MKPAAYAGHAHKSVTAQALSEVRMSTSPQRAPQSPSPSTDLRRRRFLLALGAGSAGAATAAAQPLAAIADPAAGAATAASQGYRETEHVRDYYASTRL